MRIIVNGSELKTDFPPFNDGRRSFLHLDSILSAWGRTYWIEEDGALAVCPDLPKRKRIAWLHDEWEDSLRKIDGVIFICSNRLSDVTNTEIVISNRNATITITDEMAAEESGFITNEQANDEYEPEEFSPEESAKINYGKYATPPILNELNAFSLQLDQTGRVFLDEVGFYISNEHSPYSQTPYDVIVFGHTGGDGEHYGFLTDFGTVEDLENAPIVRVSPMGGDEAVEYIAHNIREFLRIKAIDSTLVYIEFDNTDEYENYVLKEEAELKASNPEWLPTEEDKVRNREVMASMVKFLKLPEIENPYTYSKRVRQERQERVLVSTHDSLGIINTLSPFEDKEHKRLNVDEDLGIEELEDYLVHASVAGKMALIRDFNAIGCYDDEVKEAVVSVMVKLGLQDELTRMNAKEEW
ncbi:hypothetical protein EV294_105246 [Paenibacillus sp. BK033]|uniref:hypothetical protein n=1 Tax=Paenibacillus sp. BK033 TaxID=2512133 RepID=UPI001046EF4F|nr:hypothetical protein [Paenibacillus sp. BK033]TCM96379.1 hypothetical protein EV294_105246 [Paenibacillus sp. BK033]